MAKKDQSDKKFESALEELEGVVEQLESGIFHSKMRWPHLKREWVWSSTVIRN